MSETGAHPGVRSLLARFENNNQNSSTSPPSRGRSPVNSDNAGPGRPLSKVRASFVCVEKTAHSPTASTFAAAERTSQFNTVTNLKRVTSWGDKSSGSADDVEASKSSLGSSPPANRFEFSQKAVEQIANVISSPKETSEEKVRQKVSASENTPPDPDTEKASSPSKAEAKPESNTTAAAAPEGSYQKPVPALKTATKRPANVNTTKKPVSKPLSTASSKSTASSRSPTSPVNSSNSNVTKTARPSKPATTAKPASNESVKGPTHKPSRTALSSTTKATVPTTRSSTPPRRTTKSTVSKSHPASPITGKTRFKSPSRPARRPVSMAGPSLSSRGASTSRSPTRTTHATSGMSGKQSTTSKTASSGVHSRAAAPTNASVRKQASRPSLLNHSGNDRPGSRVSNVGSKSLSEGFLARLTRPTASSAGKAHDKVDVKSPPRTTKPARPPVKKTVGKDRHGPLPTKEKEAYESKKESDSSTENEENSKNDTKTEVSESAKAYQLHVEPISSQYEPPAKGERIPDIALEPVRERSGFARAPNSMAEEVVEEPAAGAVKGFTDESGEKSVESPAEKLVESSTEKPVEPTAEKPVESSAEKVESSTEQPVELPVEKPLDASTVEKSAEQLTETSTEKDHDATTPAPEEPVETPATPAVDKEAKPSVETPNDTAPIEKAESAAVVTAAPAVESAPEDVAVNIEK